MDIINKDDFFKKYNIDEKKFNERNLNWNALTEIYKDYLNKIKDLETIAGDVFNRLANSDKVHSVRKRVKNPEHLIEKIIRKSIQKPKLNINIHNYDDIITDLIGIRVLHLFKEDWTTINENIKSIWDLKEKPQANIRKGDLEESFIHHGCRIKEHKYGYRSVHYLIKYPHTKKDFKVVEIQVRTIFEEAWSEIDHTIRYPYDIDNPVLAGYLVMFNGLAGNADQMGSFIKFLKEELDYKNKELKEKDKIIKELQNEIHHSELNKEQKDKINSSLEKLSLSKKNNTSVSKLYSQLIQDAAPKLQLLESTASILKHAMNVQLPQLSTISSMVHSLKENPPLMNFTGHSSQSNHKASNDLVACSSIVKNNDELK